MSEEQKDSGIDPEPPFPSGRSSIDRTLMCGQNSSLLHRLFIRHSHYGSPVPPGTLRGPRPAQENGACPSCCLDSPTSHSHTSLPQTRSRNVKPFPPTESLVAGRRIEQLSRVAGRRPDGTELGHVAVCVSNVYVRVCLCIKRRHSLGRGHENTISVNSITLISLCYLCVAEREGTFPWPLPDARSTLPAGRRRAMIRTRCVCVYGSVQLGLMRVGRLLGSEVMSERGLSDSCSTHSTLKVETLKDNVINSPENRLSSDSRTSTSHRVMCVCVLCVYIRRLLAQRPDKTLFILVIVTIHGVLFHGSLLSPHPWTSTRLIRWRQQTCWSPAQEKPIPYRHIVTLMGSIMFRLGMFLLGTFLSGIVPRGNEQTWKSGTRADPAHAGHRSCVRRPARTDPMRPAGPARCRRCAVLQLGPRGPPRSDIAKT
ncbi:hypothetical protein P4O66_021190, partial [Electrophorus voltai]